VEVAMGGREDPRREMAGMELEEGARGEGTCNGED
jgi:hypothetical protein